MRSARRATVGVWSNSFGGRGGARCRHTFVLELEQSGTGKTKLLEADIRMDAEEGLDPDSRSQGFVLTCVGRGDGVVKLDADGFRRRLEAVRP